MKPRLLDLYCGAGGASVGYARAGFEVWGIDQYFHIDYPYPMLVSDVGRILRDPWLLDQFDVIHASPPCQAYSAATVLSGGTPALGNEDMLAETQDALLDWHFRTGKPTIIENVPGAPLRADVTLCGSAFGLQVRRHRLFELYGWTAPTPPPCQHHLQRRPVGVYGNLNEVIPNGGKTARTVSEAGDAMGITWMRYWNDLKEAIPPAYTEWLGTALLSGGGGTATDAMAHSSNGSQRQEACGHPQP